MERAGAVLAGPHPLGRRDAPGRLLAGRFGGQRVPSAHVTLGDLGPIAELTGRARWAVDRDLRFVVNVEARERVAPRLASSSACCRA